MSSGSQGNPGTKKYGDDLFPSDEYFDQQQAADQAKSEAIKQLQEKGMSETEAKESVYSFWQEMEDATKKCGDPNQTLPENAQSCGIDESVKLGKNLYKNSPGDRILKSLGKSPPALVGKWIAEVVSAPFKDDPDKPKVPKVPKAKEQPGKILESWVPSPTAGLSQNMNGETEYTIGLSWDKTTKP